MKSSSRGSHRRGLSLVAVVGTLTAGGLLATAPSASATPSTGVVINEVYGGGGNSGATFRRDFVELQNRGAVEVMLDGWSVQYHSATGTGAWQATR